MSNFKNFKKFKAALDKEGIHTQFVEPDHWFSTGIYALNFIMSGTFKYGIPNRRSTLLWGPSGTGKSYLVSNAAKNAQKDGYFVIYIDSETAADSSYMIKIGLDMSEDKFMGINVASLEEGISVMSGLFQSIDPTEKVFVIFDSLSMALPEKEVADFDAGEMKGEMGQIAKKLKLFMKNVNAKIGKFDMAFLCTGHAYQNQNVQNGEGLWTFSGGKGVEFIPSISVNLTKLKLRDEKTKETVGIRCKAEVTKSRYTRLGGRVEIEIPYTTGFDALSGLLDMAVTAGLVEQNGAWYSYKDEHGPEVKFQSKNFAQHVKNIFDLDGAEVPEESDESIESAIEHNANAIKAEIDEDVLNSVIESAVKEGSGYQPIEKKRGRKASPSGV